MSNILAKVADAMLGVTASDSVTDPLAPFAGLFVAIAGTVKFTDLQGNTITTGSLLAGTEINVAVSRVWSTGTTATVYGYRALPFKHTASS